MKRTQHDEQFGIEFARQSRPIYEKAIEAGETEKAFAKRLGVDRGGLQRYLRKYATPSLRTVVLAFREFGIAIPYAGIDTTPMISRKGRRRRVSELQMDLPLTIEAPEGEINVVVKRKSPQRFRLQLRVRKLG
jgi:transcriptional regulator with XRE-family HTH domain